MLLIHPPVAKNCEPPGGITRLAGVLRGHGFDCTVLDCSHEAFLYLLARKLSPDDTWSKRAYNSKKRNIDAIKSWQLYNNQDRYQRCVTDINKIITLAGQTDQTSISLSNYSQQKLSPLKSQDLKMAAERFKYNIFYPYFSKRLSQAIESRQPSMIGFSLNYLSQALTTFAMIGFIRCRFPQLPIVVGGGLVTSWLRNPGWNNPFSGLIDHMISGQGEKPLLDLLGWNKDPIHCPPDYSDVIDNSYFAPGFILPYAASTGCFWHRCSFCPETSEKNPYIPLPVDRVLKDLDQLSQQTNPILTHFLDNAVSNSLLDRLILRPKRLNWYGFIRFNNKLTDLDYCLALKKSGCVMLKLGLESGDQGVLDRLEKGIDLVMVSKVLNNLKQAGIATYIYLLFGTPAETIDDAQQTMDFINRHSDAISYLNLAVFNMPIGSNDTEAFPIKSFYDGDLSLYCDFVHPKNFNRRDVRRFLDNVFKRQPQIAKIIRRDPPYFTSNHAPLFHCLNSAA